MAAPLLSKEKITEVRKSSREEKIAGLKIKNESSKHIQCKIIIS